MDQNKLSLIIVISVFLWIVLLILVIKLCVRRSFKMVFAKYDVKGIYPYLIRAYTKDRYPKRTVEVEKLIEEYKIPPYSRTAWLKLFALFYNLPKLFPGDELFKKINTFMIASASLSVIASAIFLIILTVISRGLT